MRLALISMIALAAAANAVAQPVAAPPPTPAPPPSAAAPPASSAAVPPDAGAAPAAPAPAPEVPPAPPPPPAPPTDPAAIALLGVLQRICIPAANGGNLPQLAKAMGYRKNSDNNWVLRQHDFTLTVEDPGSNPNQCHVDITHPADLESPGRPIVVALNDWAGIINGWSLYRNDKSIQAGLQFTTRSWQLESDGKEQSLVFYTKRKPDGTPLHSNADESQMIYGVVKTAS